MSTTLITNGIAVDAGTMRPLDILISGNGWKASSHAAPRRGLEPGHSDASGRYALPGIIDAHNHPVYADRIDRLSGGRPCPAASPPLIPCGIGAVAAWGKQGGLVQAIDDFIRGGGNRFLHRLLGCTAP